METKTFYNEVLTDHNMHPYHKHDIDNADLELEGVNPSCGDDIILKLKFDDAKKTSESLKRYLLSVSRRMLHRI